MKPQIYILLITLLTLTLFKISYSQNTEIPFALSQFIGDTLDLAERNYYGLYQNFMDFQRAVYSVSKDGSTLFTKISYSPEGQKIDTLIEQNASYKGNLLALIRRVDVERIKNWEDPQEITLTDIKGNNYAGSFFDLEKDRLYMTTAQLTDYSQVIKNYRIFYKEDIKSVFIKGRSRNMGKKVGYGFLAGAAFGALIGYGQGDDKPGTILSMTAGQKAYAFGLAFGIVGGVIGFIAGLSVSTADEMITITTDEDFHGLAKFLKN